MALFGEKKRLGDMLVEAGLISEEQLMKALEEQKSRGTRLGETLLALNFLDEGTFANFMCVNMGYEMAEADELKEFDPRAIEMVGEALVKKHEILPFGFDPDNINAIKVAMSDPMNLGVVDDIEMATGMEVKPYFATQTQIAVILNKLYGKKDTMEAAEEFEAQHAAEYGDVEEEKADDDVGDAPIVKIVRSMIQQSVREGASDIHIEPLERSVRVRSRVDGMQHIPRICLVR